MAFIDSDASVTGHLCAYCGKEARPLWTCEDCGCEACERCLRKLGFLSAQGSVHDCDE